MLYVRREDGSFTALSAFMLLGILLAMFAAWQITYASLIALRTHYSLLQTAQQMQSNTPYQQSSLDIASWVARLNGFANVQPILGEQTTVEGKVTFGYDASIIPNGVSVKYFQRVSLLQGFLSGLIPGVGLKQLFTQIQTKATSNDSFVSVHADNSRSMLGPPPLSTTPSIISVLLQNFGVPEYPPGTPNARCCWPIDVGDTNNICSAQERHTCYEYRKYLPAYYANEPYPIWFSFNGKRPGPRPLDPGEVMGMDPNGYPSHVPPIAPSKNAPFAYYNPGINYASTNPAFDINTVAPGNNLLVCGNPMIGNFSTFGNICAIQTIAGAPNPNYPCFPLKGGSIDQLTMNPEGFRLLDYNTRGTDPAGTTASAASQCTFSSDPNKGCDPTIIGDQYGDGTYAITDRFCVAPWRVHPEWMTAWEISQGCGGAPTGTELPNLNGCATQLAGLYNHYTDFFIVYKKVFEAFLVGLSDVVPTINLSVVAGPTSGGNINELVWNPDANGGAGGGDKRLSGNRLLFDGVGLSNAHLFVQSIESQLSKIVHVTVEAPAGSGTSLTIGNNLPYLAGTSRKVAMLPHLDPAIWPVATRTTLANSISPVLPSTTISPQNNAFPGSIYLAPVDHPGHLVINDQLGNYATGVPPGRGPTYDLNPQTFAGMHPSDLVISAPTLTGGYSLIGGGDTYGAGPPAPKRYFPDPLPASLPNFQGAPIPFDPAGSWNASDGTNMFDWRPLREINYTTGAQTGAQYTPEITKSIAPHVFNEIGAAFGGTDIYGAFAQAYQDVVRAKGGTTDNPAGIDTAKGNPRPSIVLLATDGIPNLENCSSQLIPSGTTCNPIDFGTVPYQPDTHMGLIKGELDKLDDLSNTYIIVLMMVSDPSLLTDSKYIEFKKLFEGSENKVFLEFVFTNTSDFQQKFQGALEIVKALIQSFTKFV